MSDQCPQVRILELAERIAELEKVAEAAEGYCTGLFKTILGMEHSLSEAGYLKEQD